MISRRIKANLFIVPTLSFAVSCIEGPEEPISDPFESIEVITDLDLLTMEKLDHGLSEDQGSRDAQMSTGNESLDAMISPPLDLTVVEMESFDMSEALGGEVAIEWPALDLPVPEVSEELCDGLDNDFDGFTDEEVSNPCGGCDPFDEELGCVAWRAQLVQTQGVNERGEIEPGSLNPQRLVSLSASVKGYERFNIGESECVHYSLPRSWSGVRSTGEVSIDTPNASLRFIPDPLAEGRYRALSVGDTPFTLHTPQDSVQMEWTGQLDEGEADDPLPLIEPGLLRLNSPDYVELATPQELERLIDVIHRERELDTDDALLPIRWVATPRGGVAGPPLTLYIGGSTPTFRENGHFGIRHYQLNGQLFDDGRLDLIIPPRLSVPDTSVWVYLERSERSVNQAGGNPVSLNVGHRVEARRSGVLTDRPSRISILSPNPNGVEPDPPREGLSVSWQYNDQETGEASRDDLPESVRVSLILSNASKTENMTCVIKGDLIMSENPALTIPADRLDFWPREPQSVRQLSVSATFKSLALTFPDAGQWRLTDSVILRFSDR